MFGKRLGRPSLLQSSLAQHRLGSVRHVNGKMSAKFAVAYVVERKILPWWSA
jgi:hypothetical protein